MPSGKLNAVSRSPTDAPRNAGFFYFFEIRGLTGVNGSDILRLWQVFLKS